MSLLTVEIEFGLFWNVEEKTGKRMVQQVRQNVHYFEIKFGREKENNLVFL